MSEDNKRLRSYIRHLIQQEMLIIKDEESEYQQFFNQACKKFGVSDPNQLSDVKKKEFFDYIDNNYKAKDETSSVSGMGGGDAFNTPNAFAKSGKHSKRALGKSKWKKVKDIDEGVQTEENLDEELLTEIDLHTILAASMEFLKGVGGAMGVYLMWLFYLYAKNWSKTNMINSVGEFKKWVTSKEYRKLMPLIKRLKDDEEVQKWVKNPTKSGWQKMLLTKLNDKESQYLNKLTRRTLTKTKDESVNESVDFKNSEITPGRRMNQAVSSMRKSLREINKMLNKSSKFRQESGITSDKYWLRTKSSLRKLSEDLVMVMNKLNNLK